jgi:uncharacterized membrane protein YhaH (DUF805 family)
VRLQLSPRRRSFLILANSSLAMGVTIQLSTTYVQTVWLMLLVLLVLTLNLLIAATVNVQPLLAFGRTSWILSLCAYATLLAGGTLGGFGRMAPLELLFAPTSVLTGILCLGFSLTRTKTDRN